jgi:hypothetical protein
MTSVTFNRLQFANPWLACPHVQGLPDARMWRNPTTEEAARCCSDFDSASEGRFLLPTPQVRSVVVMGT